jgi:hypothetical protein
MLQEAISRSSYLWSGLSAKCELRQLLDLLYDESLGNHRP